MVDTQQWVSDRHAYPWARQIMLDEESGPPASRSPLCNCCRCVSVVGNEPVESIFEDYDRIPHQTRTTFTDHHYFLCSGYMEAFLFKTREWGIVTATLWLYHADIVIVALDVYGFKDPVFDKKMINDLVLAQDTKDMIVDLTKLFVEEKGTKKDAGDTAKSENEFDMSAWSADFVKGKGEGLIFLLHGKPGVGKTYTAGEFSRHETAKYTGL